MVEQAVPPSEAELWDDGCSNDKPRNLFVIPEVVRIFHIERPRRILDIGAGTGYIARQVAASLKYETSWTLLDPNSDRLGVATLRKPAAMLASVANSELQAFANGVNRYDAALAAFTLLEIDDLTAFAAAVWTLLVDRAVLIVALPDSWMDVLEASVSQALIASQFLHGRVSLKKIDKFTKRSYPFKAVRLEVIIQCFLSLGFHLCEIVRSETEETFLLTFRRCVGEQSRACA